MNERQPPAVDQRLSRPERKIVLEDILRLFGTKGWLDTRAIQRVKAGAADNDQRHPFAQLAAQNLQSTTQPPFPLTAQLDKLSIKINRPQLSPADIKTLEAGRKKVEAGKE